MNTIAVKMSLILSTRKYKTQNIKRYCNILVSKALPILKTIYLQMVYIQSIYIQTIYIFSKDLHSNINFTYFKIFTRRSICYIKVCMDSFKPAINAISCKVQPNSMNHPTVIFICAVPLNNRALRTGIIDKKQDIRIFQFFVPVL